MAWLTSARRSPTGARTWTVSACSSRRAVERIRIECDVEPEAACPGQPADYFYVDPETFFPVQFELPNALHYPTPSGLLDFDVVGRYLTYEYLPRT